MTLTSGTRLGTYEIVAPLGEGGMGAVYRARDTKLGRAVAIKVILDEFASNEERVGRFEREAKMLAALHHHRIASLFGLEHAEGRHFLVMELVEGETLAERLRRGAIPVEDTLQVAIQIAEALEAAHEKGVVHRDLKPANVKITPDGQVKVLDFGLAKAIESESTAGSAANSPTLSMAATQAGMILGTAAYMSPEQAKGFRADHRSDIFSFGVLLTEMLSGRQPFHGDTAPEILASVLVREPDLSRLPSDINPRLAELVKRCLEKNPRKRWQAIGDVRAELEAISAAPRASPISAASISPRSWWRRALPATMTGIAAASIAGSAVWLLKPVPAGRVVQVSLPLPPGQMFTGWARNILDVSPDGEYIVYLAGNIYVQKLSEAAPAILGSASDGRLAISPAFSPDGRAIAFHSPGDQTIKTIPVNGGTPVTVGSAVYPMGISWSGDDILAGQGAAGILRLAAGGGATETIVKVAGNEQAYGPHMLPDGEHLLFTLASGEAVDRWDRAQIVAQSLRTGVRRVLLSGASDARYSPTGHLLYAVGGSVFAVRFDPRRLEVSGKPVTVLQGVRRSTRGVSGATQFAFSRDGTLAYIAGSVTGQADSYGIAVFDAGNQIALKVPAGSYEAPRVSADGTRIAFGGLQAGYPVVFLYDIAGKTSMQPITGGGRSRLPVWCGTTQLVFQSDRDNARALFRQDIDGARSPERMTTPEPGVEHIPESCSPDGKTLLFTVARGSMYTLWSLSLPDRKVVPLISTPSTVPSGARFSHDGRWMAYCMTEGALTTIFVEPFPQTGARYQLLRRSGTEPHHPLWTPDDDELIYISGPGAFERVTIRRQPTFAFGDAVVSPRTFFGGPPVMPATYDMLPDGRIVAVVSREGEGAASAEVRVILNWFEELKGRLPK